MTREAACRLAPAGAASAVTRPGASRRRRLLLVGCRRLRSAAPPALSPAPASASSLAPAGPVRHGPGWRRAQGHRQGSRANSRGPAGSPASARSALRESDSHSPGPARVQPSPRSPLPPLPPLVSALGSGTGRLSLGRAVTSPGHRLRRLLSEVSLRTEGHAPRVHAHSRTARPVPPAHTLGVPLGALLDSWTQPSNTFDCARRPAVTRMRRNRLSYTLEPLILSCRTTHAKASPAAHRPQLFDTHQPHPAVQRTHYACLTPAAGPSRITNLSTQWLQRPSLLGERKGSQPPADGLIWRRELDVSPNPHQRLLPSFTLS